jgi:hypothetical protein
MPVASVSAHVRSACQTNTDVAPAPLTVDPFFSSGVHLAMTSGLSAATTIAANIRGDIEEDDAAKWHTSKVREGYARFLLVVLSAYKQMMHQDEPVLSDLNEDNFDRAFSFFRPGQPTAPQMSLSSS